MTSTITLSIVILNLVLCNLWKTATPAMHTKISTDPEVMKKRYATWLKRHGRHYGNREEWEVRFDIYQSNVQFIEFHNSRNHSYKLTDNRKISHIINMEICQKALTGGRKAPLHVSKIKAVVEVVGHSQPWQPWKESTR
ncbi:cathepsin L [Trifolium repens]|nr:cathepsin L [Trifolium repens]